MAHAPESVPVQNPDSSMILPISYHLQLSIVCLDDLSESTTSRLQASVRVQAPQLAIPSSPVGKDESILVGLYHHPIGGGDEAPIGVILLV